MSVIKGIVTIVQYKAFYPANLHFHLNNLEKYRYNVYGAKSRKQLHDKLKKCFVEAALNFQKPLQVIKLEQLLKFLQNKLKIEEIFYLINKIFIKYLGFSASETVFLEFFLQVFKFLLRQVLIISIFLIIISEEKLKDLTQTIS